MAAARARNVSAGGLLVTLKDPVPVGSRVSLLIQPGTGAGARGLRGRAVRVTAVGVGPKRRYDVGVRLLNDPSVTRALLRLGPSKPAKARG